MSSEDIFEAEFKMKTYFFPKIIQGSLADLSPIIKIAQHFNLKQTHLSTHTTSKNK